MSYPLAGIGTATASGTFRDLVTGRAVTGTIRFTPEAFIAAEELLVPNRISVPLDDTGHIEVQLPCGLDDDTLPMVAYLVEERFDAPFPSRPPFYLILSPADAGTTISLANPEVEIVPDLTLYMLKSGGSFTGPVTVASTLNVTGTTTAAAVNAGAVSATNITASGDLSVGDDLSVTDDLTVGGDAAVAGTLTTGALTTGALSPSSLDVDGNATVGGSLTVEGNIGWSGSYVGDFAVSGAVSAASYSQTVGGTLIPTRLFNVAKNGTARNGTKAGGGTSDSAAISAAITECGAAGGGIVYVPAGGYKIDTALLNTYSNVILRGEGQGATTFWHSVPSVSYAYVYKCAGTFAPVLGSPLSALTANAAWDQSSYSNSVAVTVTSAAGISAGDYILIGDNFDEDLDANGWINRYRGEYARVLSVASNVLTLSSQLRDDYTTARAAGVWKPAPITGCGVEDISILAADGIQGTTLTGGIQFSAAHQNHVSGVEIAGMDNSGISVVYTVGSEIRDNNVHDLTNSGSRLGYNMHVGPSEGTLITGNLFKNGRHGVTTGGANNFVGWARGVTVASNRFIGSDAAAIDTHPSTTDVAITGNTVDRCKDIGVSVRAGRTTVAGNVIDRVGDTGIWIDRKAAIETNVLNNVIIQPGNFGMEFNGNGTDGYPDKPLLMGNEVRESWNAAVRFIGPVTGLEIIGNNFRYCGKSSPTTAYAISFNVGTDDASGLIGARIIGNKATAVNAVVGATGGYVSSSIFVGNELYGGVGTAPAAIKSGQITGGTNNTISDNAEFASGGSALSHPYQMQVNSVGFGTAAPVTGRAIQIDTSATGTQIFLRRTSTSDTSAILNVAGGEAATSVTGYSINGDAAARRVDKANGDISWGSGAGAVDTTLGRVAANQLGLGAGDSLFLPNISTPATPTGGAVIFANSGVLKAIDSSGNVTTL